MSPRRRPLTGLLSVCTLALCVVVLNSVWPPAGSPAVRAADEPKDGKGSPPEKDKDLGPRRVTLKDKDIALTKALEAVAKQTGLAVERRTEEDPKVRLDLDNAPFWQALDAIAREADAKISLYERDGKLALVNGPYRELPVSYNGLFRVALKQLVVVRDLDNEAHHCLARMEIAWEPRFQAFLLENKPEELAVEDDKGPIQVGEEGKGRSGVGGRHATEVEVRFPAPKRSALKLALLKGAFAVVGAGKMLQFRFDKLAKGQAKEQDGVKVTLRQFKAAGDGEDTLWTVALTLKYPDETPNFESFQSLLVNNEALLEDAAGNRFPTNGTDEIDQSGTEATPTYRWVNDPEKKLLLQKPEGWKFLYRTPGRVVEVPVPFEFKDVELP